MYEVICTEAMDGSPVPSAATPVPLSTAEFNRVRRMTWHYPSRDICANADVDRVGADTVVSDSSGYARFEEGQGGVYMASPSRSDYDCIDQLHMNSLDLSVAYNSSYSSYPNSVRTEVAYLL